MIQTLSCRVRKIIATELGVDHDALTPTCRLSDLGADTLNLWEIAFKIEAEIDAEIDDDMRERCKTVADWQNMAMVMSGEGVS